MFLYCLVAYCFVVSGAPMAPPESASRLEAVGSQKIVYLSGTPHEMGHAQGKFLKEDIRANIQQLVHQHAIAEHGMTVAELDALAAQQSEHWSDDLQKELLGMAEGAEVEPADLRRLQVVLRPVPARSGAAFGKRTLGGRLLHLHSLEPGHLLKSRSVIFVHNTPESAGFVRVALAGCLGCLVGMNDEGMTVSVIQVPQEKKSTTGLDAPFIARRVLAEAKTLPAAIALVNGAKRSGAWTMVLGDGKAPTARVLETNAEHVAEFGPDDSAERIAPFRSLAFIVRRSNRFISERFESATSAKLPLARESMDRYAELTSLFDRKETLGSLDSLHALRSDSQPHVPAMLAVFNGSDLDFWVAFESGKENAAQQPAHRYNLRELLNGKPASELVKIDSPSKPLDPQTERVARGTIRPKRAVAEKSIPELYRIDSKSFTFESSPDAISAGIVRDYIRIPSPVETPYPENNTIPVEFFRPRGDGPFPCVMVTHIAGGDFELSRFVANTLAKAGIACAFIKLPYYGERRPPGKNIEMLSPDVGIASGAMTQAVKDLRRVCDWIQSHPDLDRDRIGMCGISLGSITGALAAGIEPRITHCCLIIGGGSLHDLIFESTEKEAREYRRLWEANGGTRETLAEIMKPFDPVTYGDRLRERVVLMINASQDESVPVVCGKALWEAAGKQRIVWYPCGHYTIVRYIMPALQHTVAFFKDWPDREENLSAAGG